MVPWVAGLCFDIGQQEGKRLLLFSAATLHLSTTLQPCNLVTPREPLAYQSCSNSTRARALTMTSAAMSVGRTHICCGRKSHCSMRRSNFLPTRPRSMPRVMASGILAIWSANGMLRAFSIYSLKVLCSSQSALASNASSVRTSKSKFWMTTRCESGS